MVIKEYSGIIRGTLSQDRKLRNNWRDIWSGKKIQVQPERHLVRKEYPGTAREMFGQDRRSRDNPQRSIWSG